MELNNRRPGSCYDEIAKKYFSSQFSRSTNLHPLACQRMPTIVCVCLSQFSFENNVSNFPHSDAKRRGLHRSTTNSVIFGFVCRISIVSEIKSVNGIAMGSTP